MERELPQPAPLRKLIGPSVILVGVGVASGEYILFPYIAATAGLAFLWAAVVGVAMQFFINMEIERYTLATGQTAITGEEAAPSGRCYRFPADERNRSRWREWWRRANLEQFFSFGVVAALSIIVFSLVAYSTVFGNPDLPDESGFDFIALEADVLDERVGNWFGTLFLVIGAVSLFAAALGIVDYVSRLVADVVRVGYTSDSARWTESRIYFAVVWTMVLFGTAILALGFDQPLVLVTISTVLGGVIMFVYSILLVITNRRYLPDELKLRGYRLAIIAGSIVLLGVCSTIVGVNQFGNLFE